jgi:hypothetical protein
MSGDLLAHAIERSEHPAAETRTSDARDELGALVERVVKPHLATKAHPQHVEMIATLDLAASALLRALRHVPDFQALEAAWRAWSEESKLPKGSSFSYSTSLRTAGDRDTRSTNLHRILVEPFEGQPWALLAGNYTFGPSRSDAELLERLAIPVDRRPAFTASRQMELRGRRRRCEVTSAVESTRGSRHAPEALCPPGYPKG